MAIVVVHASQMGDFTPKEVPPWGASFLRSFRDDAATMLEIPGAPTVRGCIAETIPGIKILDPGMLDVEGSVESRLGVSTEHHPNRLATPEAWNLVVWRMVRNSNLVVALPGPTHGVAWELGLLAAAGGVTSTVLLFPLMGTQNDVRPASVVQLEALASRRARVERVLDVGAIHEALPRWRLLTRQRLLTDNISAVVCRGQDLLVVCGPLSGRLIHRLCALAAGGGEFVRRLSLLAAPSAKLTIRNAYRPCKLLGEFAHALLHSLWTQSNHRWRSADGEHVYVKRRWIELEGILNAELRAQEKGQPSERRLSSTEVADLIADLKARSAVAPSMAANDPSHDDDEWELLHHMLVTLGAFGR